MKEFIEIFNKFITRQGADALLQWLQESDFFVAPASTRFHGSYAGGLVAHSLNVWNELCLLMKAYKNRINATYESVAIISLLHDVCKIGCYKVEQRNVKENGQWVTKPYYTFVEDFPFGGHGAKSVYLINKFLTLTDEEAVAINCHMGFSNSDAKDVISNAFSRYHLAWLLHVADEAATYVIES